MFLIRPLLFILWWLRCGAQETTDDFREHNEWIDPNDPTTHLRRSAPQMYTCERVESAEPTLKLILRGLFRQIHVDPSQRVGFYRAVTAQMGKYDVELVQTYLDTANPTPEQRDAVRNALNNIFEVTDLGIDDPSRFQLLLRMIEPWIVPLNILVAILTLIYVMKQLFSSGRILRILLLLIFVISLFTSYNRMYQEKMAERIAQSMQANDACKPPGILSRFKSFISIEKKSECLKFIEAQTVSVIFEISPLDVLFDVLGNGLFSLMEHFATRLNKATIALYDGLPIPLQIAVTIAVLVIFLVIFLFGVARYRIGFFGMRFEPAIGAGLLDQIGAAANGVINALESPGQQNQQTPHQSQRAWIENVTPRTKDRMSRMLPEANNGEHHRIRHRSPSPSPKPRSHSTPRIALTFSKD